MEGLQIENFQLPIFNLQLQRNLTCLQQVCSRL
jgi:hypothetical protein